MESDRNDNRHRQLSHPVGGQHRSPAGLTTLDSQSDQERIERLRRINATLGEVFDEESVRQAYSVRNDERLATWIEQQELAKYRVPAGREW